MTYQLSRPPAGFIEHCCTVVLRSARTPRPAFFFLSHVSSFSCVLPSRTVLPKRYPANKQGHSVRRANFRCSTKTSYSLRSTGGLAAFIPQYQRQKGIQKPDGSTRRSTQPHFAASLTSPHFILFLLLLLLPPSTNSPLPLPTLPLSYQQPSPPSLSSYTR